MKLPAALTPWAKHLQIFPEEISLVLGDYAQKISPFINPIISNDVEADGEPNGYDGVNRRGIYERLLISELALADDFSEEFVRRAVMGEHLFLNLAKTTPSSKRVSIILFDAGAMQIGTPRIAHLAALIVFARRAEAAGAMFLWGVLQNEKQLVISDDTEASVKILLESRTPHEVTTEDLAAWREKLSELDKFADVWLVGSQDLATFEEAKGFSRLCIDESLELEKRELELRIKTASGVEKKTILELPPLNICTRLLRNPFEISSPVNVSVGKLGGNVSSFFFDAAGTKLFAKLNSQDVKAFSVLNNNAMGSKPPTTYKSFDSKPLIAIGRLNKATGLVTKFNDEKIRLFFQKHGISVKSGFYKIKDSLFKFPEEGKLLQVFATTPRHSQSGQAAILDANGNLFQFAEYSEIDAEYVVGELRLLATNVLAVTKTDREFMYLGCEDGNEYHHLVTISETVSRKSLSGKRLARAFFGRGERGGKTLAFEDKSGNWNILTQNDEMKIFLRSAGEYVGVYYDPRFAPSEGMFELMEDRQTLEFTWAYGRRKSVLKADAEIKEIEFCSRSPLLAYKTENELVIYSLTHKTAIGRYSK